MNEQEFTDIEARYRTALEWIESVDAAGMECSQVASWALGKMDMPQLRDGLPLVGDMDARS